MIIFNIENKTYFYFYFNGFFVLDSLIYNINENDSTFNKIKKGKKIFEFSEVENYQELGIIYLLISEKKLNILLF